MSIKYFGAVLALLGAAACNNDNALPLPLVGTLERDRIALIAEASERVLEITVSEGDAVTAGQVLMHLDAVRQEVGLRKAMADRDAAAQRLAELVRGPRAESIRESQARLQGAEDNLDVQAREFRRIEDLVGRGLMAEFDLDRARNALESANAEVESLRAALDALIVGTTPEELGQAQAQLEAAEATVAARRIEVERMTIRAPRAGQIESLPFKTGAHPQVGDAVINMLADQAPYARVYVPEALRASVSPGTVAEVAVDGIADRFEARVRYVAAEATFTPYYALTERDRGRLSFLSEVTLLDEGAQMLPSGIAVEVHFPGLSE